MNDPALSARETEVMEWVANGKTNAEIGQILGISPYTVKNHMVSIFIKLGASNRVEAALFMCDRKSQRNSPKR
jgi:DNA-binding CsgD family transcriptional regulator